MAKIDGREKNVDSKPLQACLVRIAQVFRTFRATSRVSLTLHRRLEMGKLMAHSNQQRPFLRTYVAGFTWRGVARDHKGQEILPWPVSHNLKPVTAGTDLESCNSSLVAQLTVQLNFRLNPQ